MILSLAPMEGITGHVFRRVQESDDEYERAQDQKG